MTILHATDLAIAKRGKTYSLLSKDASILESVIFDSSTWGEGLMQGTVVKDDILIADTETGGTWSTSIPVGALITPSEGVQLSWSATSGVTVEYSTNGTAWTATANRRLLIEGSTTSIFYIRITIPTVNDYVRYIRADVLESRVSSSMNGGGKLFYSKTFMDDELDHQLYFQSDSGAHLRAGYLEIQPDTDETPTTVRTIETWMKFENLTTGTLFTAGSATLSLSGTTLTFSGMTVYRNGVAFTSGSTVSLFQWNHWVFVLPANINTPTRFQGVFVIGHLATYDYAMTAAQALTHYNYITVGSTVRANDASAIVITEPAPPVDIYAYQWSFSGA